MEELATLLLAPDGGGGLHPESDGRWAPWRAAGSDRPPDLPAGAATEFGRSGLERDVPVRIASYITFMLNWPACLSRWAMSELLLGGAAAFGHAGLERVVPVRHRNCRIWSGCSLVCMNQPAGGVKTARGTAQI